jgi:transposase
VPNCYADATNLHLTGRLMPDFKTIANFLQDNSKAIRGVCRQFVVLCQKLGHFGGNMVAIDGSKFKAVNKAANGRNCIE